MSERLLTKIRKSALPKKQEDGGKKVIKGKFLSPALFFGIEEGGREEGSCPFSTIKDIWDKMVTKGRGTIATTATLQLQQR